MDKPRCFQCGNMENLVPFIVLPEHSPTGEAIIYICRHGHWEGVAVIDAFTGLPVTLTGNSVEQG